MWGNRNSNFYRDKCIHAAILETCTMSSLNKTVNLRPPTALLYLTLKPTPRTLLCCGDTCTFLFIAGLITIAKMQNQPQCPSADCKCDVHTQWDFIALQGNLSNETYGKMGGVGQRHTTQVTQTQKNKAYSTHTWVQLMVCKWRL